MQHDKVISTAYEAVADIGSGPWWRWAASACGSTNHPDRGPDPHDGFRSADRVQQLRDGRFGAGGAARPAAGGPGDRLLLGENKEFARQYLAGELEVELVPQGSLAERMRAGDMGIPAFYTPAGVGTLVVDGGLPWRFDTDGTVLVSSPPKKQRSFDPDDRGERTYVLEHAIVADCSLVPAWKADTAGNLVFRRSASNFNPLCARCAQATISEAKHLVEPGEIDPAEVHGPGIFVDRVLAVAADDTKRIRESQHSPRPIREAR